MPLLLRTDAEEVVYNEQYANNDFDDVFGSAPPSPTARESNEIWNRSGGNLEPSDVPKLKEKHETEGYRDGITKGKAETVQAGFDEGYGLGATLGLRIGKILGLLEGISRAVESAAGEDEERLGKLLGEARAELKTESVFGSKWWGEDGIWKYEVPGGEDVTFPDVAGAHPLVVKWEAVIREELKRWNLDLGIMDREHTNEVKITKAETEEVAERSETAGTQKAEFSW